MIEIHAMYDSGLVIQRLNEIAAQVDDMRPLMRGIGEALTESTKQRFSDSQAPDGSRWKPLAQSTILRKTAGKGSFAKKTGKLTKNGIARVLSLRPLVDTGILRDTIRYIASREQVEIGTNRFFGDWDEGAAVHQFGRLDGTIPARPFLGVSSIDEKEVLDILDDFLRQALSKG